MARKFKAPKPAKFKANSLRSRRLPSGKKVRMCSFGRKRCK